MVIYYLLLSEETLNLINIGYFNADMKTYDKGLIINGEKVRVFNDRDASKVMWGEVDADYICESTGAYTKKEKANDHLKGGAKKVIISAPPKDDIPIYVMGVNHKEYKSE